MSGIRTQTSYVTHGSVTSPLKCGNDRYSPHLLICTVLGLEPRPSRTQAFVLVRQTLSIKLHFRCQIRDFTQPLHGTFPEKMWDLVGALEHVECREPHDLPRSSRNLEQKMVDREALWQPLWMYLGRRDCVGGHSSLNPFPRFLNTKEEEERRPQEEHQGT